MLLLKGSWTTITNPERASRESDHATGKAWFLASRRDALVDAFPKPNIGLHVPGVKQDFEVFREFNGPDFDVGRTIPNGPILGVEAGKTKTGENAGALIITVGGVSTI